MALFPAHGEGHHDRFTLHPPCPDRSQFPCFSCCDRGASAPRSLGPSAPPPPGGASPASDEETNKQTLAVIHCLVHLQPVNSSLDWMSSMCSMRRPWLTLAHSGHWDSIWSESVTERRKPGDRGPMRDEQLGARCGTSSSGPDVGRAARGPMWDEQLGARCGTSSSGPDVGRAGRGPMWDEQLGAR